MSLFFFSLSPADFSRSPIRAIFDRVNRKLLKICRAVREAGGRAMQVGGSVRDRLLGLESKDLDLEVYSLEPERLRAILETLGTVNTVGEHFSIYKLVYYRSGESLSAERIEVDVSIPRRESKSGRGHRGFVIEGDPFMTFEEAARRRDFTVNAILYDPLTDETIDPFGGVSDLEARILRAVAADTFVEDSLRVLRAMQLVARFEMEIAPETIELCRKIDLSDLPHERVWGEMEKLLTIAERPSIGLQAALDLGILDKLFPDIRALASRPQEGEGDEESDAFMHTKLCLDEAARLATDLTKEKRVTLMLAALCHDLGANEIAGGERQSLERIKAIISVLDVLGVHTLSGYDIRSQALALTREQAKPREIYIDRDVSPDGRIRRLSEKVDMDLLYRVAKACALGRGSSAVAEDWFIEKARSLGVERQAPAPLLLGRHLLEEGFEPGPRLGKMLRRVYELQLDGEITTFEEALKAARRLG